MVGHTVLLSLLCKPKCCPHGSSGSTVWTASICVEPLWTTCNDRGDAGRISRTKKLDGKQKHIYPLINSAIESNNRYFNNTSNRSAEEKTMAVNCNNSNCSSNTEASLDLYSPTEICSSKEINSPTDLNSCKQIRDKPPLLKNLDVVREVSDDSFSNAVERLSSSESINEESPWKHPSALRSSFTSESNLDIGGFSTNETSSSGNHPTTMREETRLESLSNRIRKRSSRLSFNQTSSFSDVPISSEHLNASCCKKWESIKSSSSASVTPPPPPERHDSLCTVVSEERELRGAPWFQAGIPREIALEILSKEPAGAFMVRESTSKAGCFALSLRVTRDFHQSGIAHYLIMRTIRGYKIKGFTKEFGTLTALITHHSVMPELLPCPLSLARYNPTIKKHDSRDMVDIDEDPNYNSLLDFRKLLADIHV